MSKINKVLNKLNKKREQEQVLNLNNQASKYMVNASFYRPKFRIIDLMNNC